MKTFEEKCGLSSGYVASMRKGFGREKLNNVLIAYPQLNKDWLLTGEGEMIIAESSQVVRGDNNNQITGGQGSIVVDASNRLIDEMAAQRQMFSDLITEKDRQINKLLQLLSKDK
ncbi:MAG: hypothetical protein IJS19_05605 [Muribaculaceae bacterium]|nr:hypothetical protein [Muribaculaceae bacterium]